MMMNVKVDYVEPSQNVVHLKLLPRVDYTRHRGALKSMQNVSFSRHVLQLSVNQFEFFSVVCCTTRQSERESKLPDLCCGVVETESMMMLLLQCYCCVVWCCIGSREEEKVSTSSTKTL